jgi:hypothetical protein
MATCSLAIYLSVLLAATSSGVSGVESANIEPSSAPGGAVNPNAEADSSLPKEGIVLDQTSAMMSEGGSNHSNAGFTSPIKPLHVRSQHRLPGESVSMEMTPALLDATVIVRAEWVEIDRIFARLGVVRYGIDRYGIDRYGIDRYGVDHGDLGSISSDLGQAILHLGRFQLLDSGDDRVNRLLIRDYTLARYGDLISLLKDDLPAEISLTRLDRTMLQWQLQTLVNDATTEMFGEFNKRQRRKLYELIEDMGQRPVALRSDDLDWLVISLMSYEEDQDLFAQLVSLLPDKEDTGAEVKQ